MTDRRPPELIGQSRAFQEALAHASSAAGLDRPLLIVGERGSGKELIAGRIHYLSPRWEKPFVKVNCAALSEELLDSELFGHEAGAFTGAQKRHLGRFERAEGGTLFLDEIASASMRVQEKLLRVIEYGEFERLGGEQTRTADVRVIAAANVDLEARAAESRFRADLLDRLAFDVIAAPPLRARKEDIPLLAAHFASVFAQESAEADAPMSFEGFTPRAMAAFAAHDWPGNVRELKNAAERSLFRWSARGARGPIDEALIDAFAGARVREASAPPRTSPNATRPIGGAAVAHGGSALLPPSGHQGLRACLDDMEKRLALEALDAAGWSQKNAATLLKLSYDQMRGLVRKHGLAPSARRGE
ncbi:MAG: sigma 54-interacting transcriptional regulator [Parvularculaceae bacterium]